MGALVKLPPDSQDLRIVGKPVILCNFYLPEPNDATVDVSVEVEGFFEPYRNEYFSNFLQYIFLKSSRSTTLTVCDRRYKFRGE